MADENANMQGLNSKLEGLKLAVKDFRNGKTSFDELTSVYNEIKHNRELYKSANFNMRSYTKIMGDAGNVINDAERGMAEAGSRKYGRRDFLKKATAIGAAALTGGIVTYIASEQCESPKPETPAATRYEGDFAGHEPKNATLSFRTDNGKSSFSIKGTQESGEFAAASRKTRGNAKIHIDTRGELSLNLSDPNDPNDMNLDFWGDRNGGHAVFNGTEKGDYKARIKNKGPIKCRNNLR